MYKTFNDVWEASHGGSVQLICLTARDELYMVDCAMEKVDCALFLELYNDGKLIQSTYVDCDETSTHPLYVNGSDEMMVFADPQIITDRVNIETHRRLRDANAQKKGTRQDSTKQSINKWRVNFLDKLYKISPKTI